jgi:hypothetical protein
MTARGHVKNGVVVLDEPISLPEGTAVTLVVREARDSKPAGQPAMTDYERLKSLIGKAKGLPPDLAKNHDHYLHGRPKR